MKLVSWNIARADEPWRLLARSDVDVALLQEAAAPPPDVTVDVDTAPWATSGPSLKRLWRTAIAKISDRVRVHWRLPRALPDARHDELRVSCPGTLAVADVDDLATGETMTVISMYGAWENPAAETGSSWIYADASVHRLISDISAMVGHQRGHRIIAAGDLNILHGYGEDGSAYWKRRYATVFERFEAIGLRFVGPQAPNGGVQANPRPSELPPDSLNVPTYRTRRTDPASATRQLDFVFASEALRERTFAGAANRPEQWGPSDHCRIVIELT